MTVAFGGRNGLTLKDVNPRPAILSALELRDRRMADARRRGLVEDRDRQGQPGKARRATGEACARGVLSVCGKGEQPVPARINRCSLAPVETVLPAAVSVP